MKTILILDAVMGAAASSDLDDLLPARSTSIRSDQVPEAEHIDQIFLIDHGTLDCLTAAREALAYRRHHPQCRVRVLREFESERCDAEALLRGLAPRQDVETVGVAVAAVPELVRSQGEFSVKLDEEGPLFEYAA